MSIFHRNDSKSKEINARIRHALYYLGQTQKSLDDPSTIQSMYPQIKNAWAKLTNPHLKLDFIWAVKEYQNRNGLWEDYEHWLQECIEQSDFDSITKEGKWALYNNWGTVAYYRGEAHRALQILQTALELAYEEQSSQKISKTLSNMAGICASIGQWPQTIALCERALLQTNDILEQAEVFLHLSRAYSDLKQFENALNYADLALKNFITGNGEHGSGYARANFQLGRVYLELKQIEKAVNFWQRAQQEAQQLEDKVLLASCHTQLARAYGYLGQFIESQEELLEAIPLQEAMSDNNNLIFSLYTLGQLQVATQQMDKAQGYLERALSIARQLNHPNKLAALLNDVGQIYTALNLRAEAVTLLHESVALREQLQDENGLAVSLTNLATALWISGSRQEAFIQLKRAYITQSEKPSKLLFTILNNIIKLAEVNGQYQVALHYIEIALSTEDAIYFVDMEHYRKWQEKLNSKIIHSKDGNE
ncbi:MAG: tetratricopeptide repeat protein [Chloroflexota bacterium]